MPDGACGGVRPPQRERPALRRCGRLAHRFRHRGRAARAAAHGHAQRCAAAARVAPAARHRRRAVLQGRRRPLAPAASAVRPGSAPGRRPGDNAQGWGFRV